MRVTREFTWIVVAPGGAGNVGLACEAARAGAWGLVDLEDAFDEPGLRRGLDRAAGADVRLGLRLDASRRALWEPPLAPLASSFTRVVLTRAGRDPLGLQPLVSGLKGLGLDVLVEAVSVDEAQAAQDAGADGVVAKGSEAGGRVGDETCFLLLQRLAGKLTTPLYAQGGVGLHTAAACSVAGARGAVLDWQVGLVDESRLPAELRRVLSRLDGSETVSVGHRVGDVYRLHAGLRSPVLEELEGHEQRLAADAELTEAERLARWRAIVDDTLGRHGDSVRKIGMDVSFAARLADRFPTIGALIDELERSRRFHLSRACQAPPLRPGAGVSSVIGTRHSVVQGPMSRVSDTAGFAGAVAEGGALPVMAVAAMRPDELETMLAETKERLGDRAWGAGLLGFLPPELYGPQVELVKKYRPPVAVIAGGRPPQAREFEKEGIRAFIHVPSHRLLDLYLDDGVTSMIFEGLECGGHIGRYSAFVLWENAIEVLLERAPRGASGPRAAALFAGGISTALSAAMVSSIVAPLADRGVDVGVLVGTGYLFTREAVEHGAIGSGFQSTVLDARQTSILDCGGGYRIRAAPTPFCSAFEEEKQRLKDEGRSAEDVRMELEHLTLGRLRMAAKGLRFNEAYREDRTQPLTLAVPEPEQRRDGVYMAGQTILLHDSVYSVADLHRWISEESAELLRGTQAAVVEVAAEAVDEAAPIEVAIVGISGIFPGAPNTADYWENIVAGQYSITEVPPEQWNVGAYFDPDPKARDRIYSRWGGFVDPIEFDPVRYGIPPKSLASIDPVQILTLEMVGRALRDAGYDRREFDRERTSVFVGEGGGMGNLGQLYSFRALLPMFLETVPEEVLGELPEWTENTFPGLLPNVIAGRVTNQFDLGGTNLSTSAACAAGLAALSLGMDELASGESHVSIVAAVDVQQNPFMYMCFSKTMALSPTGTPRCFDSGSDGIVISQGLGVLILKRLEDAERDGDRVYAVLRGMGSSSDGRGKSLTAPTSRGQLRAIRRAYRQAGFGLDTVQLVEAHGTGTVLGDRTEAESITHALRDAGARPRSCAVGTVKSMIGHTKGCAGVAGLIKVALALHHKVLPPTLWVEKPAAAELWTGDAPAYLNTALRPWVEGEHPRRAAVSSFGFGGTNFHAVLEEHRPEGREAPRFPTSRLPAELFCLRHATAAGLREDAERLLDAATKPVSLRDLAHRTFRDGQGREASGAPFSLSVVADSVEDLRRKLERARPALASAREPLVDPSGIYFHPAAPAREGKLAVVFPGQGSQRVDMLKDLALLFEELRETLARADRILAPHLPLPLSQYVYPPPSFTDEDKAAAMAALTRTDVTQPALGAVELGVFRVLRALGIQPDMAAGHSVGEYVALAAASVFDEETLFRLLFTRGDCMLRAAGDDAGTMMAIRADRETVEKLVAGEQDVYVANYNAPRQTVVAGRRETLVALQSRLASQAEARLLPVGCGFHSPFVAKAAEEFGQALAGVSCEKAAWPVYSNDLAAAFDGIDVREALRAHLSHPVRFVEEIERMHADGARVFVEVGPGKVCTSLIGEILEGRPHHAVACDGAPSRLGAVRLLHALGQLHALGLDLHLDPLYNRRPAAPSIGDAATGARPKVTWMVAPEVSWPAGTPRPRITPQPIGPHPSRPAPAPSASPVPAPRPTAPAPGPMPLIMTPQRLTVAPAGGNGSQEKRNLVPTLPASQPPTPPESAAVPTAPPPGRGPDGALTEVVLRHQQLMAAFVEQQTQVMLAYLESRRGAGTVRLDALPHPAPGLLAAPAALAPSTGVVPVAPSPAPIPPAAVAPPSAPAPAPPATAVSVGAPSPVSHAPAPTGEELLQRLVAFVADRTGYPEQMLTGDQEMEKDLGIDSIKRVEILTSFARQLPGLGSNAVEQLREARTLQDVVQAIQDNLNGAPVAPQAAASPAPSPSPAAVPAAPSPTEAVAPAEASREGLLRQLVTFVAERTGYPEQMLTGDQEMERDLGIDSIKRVEILTSFARQFPTLGSSAVEQLREARTLDDVARAMHESLAGRPAEAPAAAASASPERPSTNGSVDRYVIAMAESRPPDRGAPRLPAGVLLVTDDGRGVATSLCERVRSLGGKAVLVRLEGADAPAEGVYGGRLDDAAGAEALVDRVRKDQGPIGGVVHLLPLREVPPIHELSSEAFDRVVGEEVKGLFHLLRFAASDLKSTPGTWAVTGLSFGGSPANGSLPIPDHPWRGGLIGVLKTVAVEWPSVAAKSLVLEGPYSDDTVDVVLAEASGPTSEHEIYSQGGVRLVPQPRKAPLEAEVGPLELGPDDVILVVGGARGITSEVAREIARQARSTLVLVGRSPWPEPEGEETAAAVTDADLRRVLFAQIQGRGGQPSPIEVDRTARRILREREMREARSQMEAAGSRVFYYPADIRDEAATALLLRRIADDHGHLDGVIFGAGVIEDKLIEEKTPESFNRVFDTKVRAIFHLARGVQPETLKFFVMFSSVAGWTGNRGQVDYVAANEMLNRMALHLSHRWGRRVVAVDWGPWDKAGMVTPETRRQFLDRGVGLVPPDAGRQFLLDELRLADSSHPIVAAMARVEPSPAAVPATGPLGA